MPSHAIYGSFLITAHKFVLETKGEGMAEVQTCALRSNSDLERRTTVQRENRRRNSLVVGITVNSGRGTQWDRFPEAPYHQG